MLLSGSDFTVNKNTTIRYSSQLRKEAEQSADRLYKWSNLKLEIQQANHSSNGNIFLGLTTDKEKAESYNLSSTANQVIITSNSKAGIFYTSQTLIQLISPIKIITIKGVTI